MTIAAMLGDIRVHLSSKLKIICPFDFYFLLLHSQMKEQPLT